MAGRWLPEEYVAPNLPWLRNMFENTAAVQFNHRTLAAGTTAAVTALALWVRGLPLPPRLVVPVYGVVGVTAVQVRWVEEGGEKGEPGGRRGHE